MVERRKISIACPHEAIGLGISEVVSDYHSLNRKEIASLLTMASLNWKDPTLVSEVQVRLNQGIVGITCPRPITGKVAEKLNEMDRLFMDKYKEGGSPDLVDKIFKIMTK